MFSKAILSSLLLAALANGLAFRRDDGFYSNTPADGSLPTGTPQPDNLLPLSLPPLNPNPTDSTLTGTPLPDPSFVLSLPPLDPSSTSLTSLPTGTPLPDPSFSLTLPPLPSSTGIPTGSLLPSSSLPSIVTTTVYVYPSQCSPTGTVPPASTPSGDPDNDTDLGQDDEDEDENDNDEDDDDYYYSSDVQPTPLVLPPVRRGVRPNTFRGYII